MVVPVETIFKHLIYLTLVIIMNACAINSAQTTPSPTVPIRFMKDVSDTQEAIVTQSIPTPAPRLFSEGIERDAQAGSPPLAARVNGQPIFLETYERQVGQYGRDLAGENIDFGDTLSQDRLAQIEQNVLQGLIDQAIMEQEANKLGISINEEQLEAKALESAAQDQDKFEVWLGVNHITYPEFKEILRFQLVANQLFEQITTDIPGTADQVQLRQILVSDETVAREIIDQLKQENGFGALVEQYSLDELSRASGGDLGWFPKGIGLVPPEVEYIAFTLQPGEVSGPIQTSLGFHIIQLEGKETARQLTLEMHQALKAEKFRTWLTERRTVSKIENFVGS